MSFAKDNLERIILGFYNYFAKYGIKKISIDCCHLIVESSITVSQRARMDYLKQLTLLDFLKNIGSGYFEITDLMISKGKEIFETHQYDIISADKKEDEFQNIDDAGFFKY